MHARGVVPDEERLVGLLGAIHEALGLLDQHFVEGLHVVFGVAALLPHLVIRGHILERLERAFVDDALLADLAPARHHRRIVGIGRVGMHQVARAVFVDPVLRIVEPVRIGHRVEVVEVTEEFVEAVHRRQIFVQVAEMVLAELAGGVAHRFEQKRRRHRLLRHADVGAGLADRGEPGAQRNLPGDEVGAAGGAARFGVVVGEAHAVGGELVEVRRLAGHDALVIGADIEPADIVAHDDENVRLLAGGRRLLRLRDGLLHACGRAQRRCCGERRAGEQHIAAIECAVF